VGKILIHFRNAAIGIIAVAIVAVIRYSSLPFDTRYVLAIVFAAVVFLIVLVPNHILANRITSGAQTRRPQDASHVGHLPGSARTQQMITELNKMGFTRIGETTIDVPGNKDGITWLLGNPDRTITVEVVDMNNGMCQFSTVFEDLAIIETSHPIGDNINKPNYYSRKNTQGLRPAYHAHVNEAKTLMGVHGRPKPIPTIAAHLEWDIIYRERYIKYKMTTHTMLLGMVLIVIVLVMGTVLAFI
jgi:hypothetical protein